MNRSYWENRYQAQGERTVAFCGFKEAEFLQNKTRLQRWMEEELGNEFAGKMVLDFGCGVGRFSEVIERCGGIVFGFDIVRWALSRCQMKFPWTRLAQYDGERLPIKSESLEVIFSWTVLQHIPPSQISFVTSDFYRILRSGGKVIALENVTPNLPDKSHIWFRSVGDYDRLLSPLKRVSAMFWKGMDGNEEIHALMKYVKSDDEDWEEEVDI